MFSFLSGSSRKETIDDNNDDVVASAINEADPKSIALRSPHGTMSSGPSMSTSPLTSDPGLDVAKKDNESADKSTTATAHSWTLLHEEYCHKHCVVRASFWQVLRDSGIDVENSQLSLPSRSSVIITANDVASAVHTPSEELQTSTLKQESSTSTEAAATGRSTLSLLASPLSWSAKVVTSLLQDSNDYSDEEEWIQEDDDAFADLDPDDYAFEDKTVDKDVITSTNHGYGTSSPIINLPLIRQAIQLLEQEINDNSSLSFHGEMPVILGVSEWDSWATAILSKGKTTTKKSLSNIPFSDKDFLLKVMMELNVANIIRRRAKSGSSDLIVLFPSSMVPTQKTEEISEIPENLRIPVTLWDLQSAERIIERQIQDWSAKVDECHIHSLKLSRENKKSAALHFMRKRKRLLKEIEMASQKLVNIENTKSAIESSQSNKMVVDVLAGSTKLLKDMRGGTSIENVDDVMIDLQQELDDQKEFHDAISASNDIAMGGPVSDEDLLKELEDLGALSLEEMTFGASKKQSNEEAANALQNDMNAPMEFPNVSTSNTKPKDAGSDIAASNDIGPKHDSGKKAETAS